MNICTQTMEYKSYTHTGSEIFVSTIDMKYSQIMLIEETYYLG